MKIPHGLFRLINMVMVLMLRSPAHRLFSGSILAIRYTGVKSGRRLTVPARYLVDNEKVHVVTSRDTRWWPNFVSPSNAEVLLAGRWVPASIHATPDSPVAAEPILRRMWAQHPSDAAYMDVKLNDGEPDPEDLRRALKTAVLLSIERQA